jgi:2-dehydro-3-deoxyphosphogalactonate aldolase
MTPAAPDNEMPLSALPLVAILRGVSTEQVVKVATVLHQAGIRAIEVPLNSPDPFASIAALSAAQLPNLLVGAGTVLNEGDVRRTHQAGGRLVVSPNCNPNVIRTAVQLAMRCMPGVATATEVFTAIDAGARDLKLFPAVTLGPGHLQALTAVLPVGVKVFPVGGVALGDIPQWLRAGAAGFGFGSELFRPNYSLEEIGQRARDLVQVFLSARTALQQQ